MPQGASASSPRLARQCLPWVIVKQIINRNAGVSNVPRDGVNGKGRNRVAVGDVWWTMTQGSSCLATLGFGTESRWDSRMARARDGVMKSNRVRARTIPKGLRPPAQGWRSAYLG